MSADLTLAEVFDRVRRLLVAMEMRAEVFGENGFALPFDEHVVVFVTVEEQRSDDGEYVRFPVDCFARIISGVPVTQELLEYLAFPPTFTWGNLVTWRGDDGLASISYRSTLLGDYLDEKELSNAIYTVAGTTEDLVAEMHPRFGGKRFGDD